MEEQEGYEFLDENEEASDKELIALVRANSFLYNKADKLYKNNDIKKASWTAIGEHLSKKKTGIDAERRFFQLRQRFGRERKKVVQSQCRSGAGTDHVTYQPKWDLYFDLIFLTDIIKHRNTSSNYKRKASEAVLCDDDEINHPSASTSNSCISTQNLFVDENVTAITSEWDGSEYANISSPEPSQVENLISFSEDGSFRRYTEQVKKVHTNTCDKRVPSSDSFAQRKRQKTDDFNKYMLQQSKELDVLTQKIGDALSSCSEPASVISPSYSEEVKTMLNAIGFAMQKVPEYQQLDCLIATLQLIKSFY